MEQFKMHEWTIQTVVLPTIKAMAELCEKLGVSFVCHIEHKDGLTWDSVTHHVQADASDTIKNTLEAAQGRLR